jgi:hypothetical protein
MSSALSDWRSSCGCPKATYAKIKDQVIARM